MPHWYTCEDTGCGWHGSTSLYEPGWECPDCGGPTTYDGGDDGYEDIDGVEGGSTPSQAAGLPSAERAAEALGIPTERWVGNCYAIAVHLTRIGLVHGRPAYGHYLGPVSPRCRLRGLFTSRVRPHGWILMPDGRVCDPTRWVWTDTEPELWVGTDEEYDEGGNIFRRQILGELPPPDGLTVEIELPYHAIAIIGATPEEPVHLNQLVWLANLPPDEIAPAEPVYRALEQAGLIAAVPIDNRTMVGFAPRME